MGVGEDERVVEMAHITPMHTPAQHGQKKRPNIGGQRQKKGEGGNSLDWSVRRGGLEGLVWEKKKD